MEKHLGESGLWEDAARAADLLKERGALVQAVEEWQRCREQVEDLEPFDPRSFVDALFAESQEA